MKDTISTEKLDKYLDTTKRALDKLKIAAPPRSFGRRMAEDFLTMQSSEFNVDAVMIMYTSTTGDSGHMLIGDRVVVLSEVVLSPSSVLHGLLGVDHVYSFK